MRAIPEVVGAQMTTPHEPAPAPPASLHARARRTDVE
jgi:hypothetical protein